MTSLLFLEDPVIKKYFLEIQSCLTGNCNTYIISGSVRNSLYYYFHQKKLPQRDFDMITIGNPAQFISNLQAKGRFNNSKYPKTNSITLKKIKNTDIQTEHQPRDNIVVLDIHYGQEWQSIEDNLREHANFTLNGSAINIRDIMQNERMKNIITLPTTLQDIEDKQLRLNAKHTDEAAIFAYMRFMSQWFKPQSEEIPIMLEALKNITPLKFERNIPKLYDYVWGEENARQLLQQLNIQKDIFNFDIATQQ